VPRLRLRQTTTTPDHHRVNIIFEQTGSPPREANAEFSFELTPQDREGLRWYLEDYLQCPLKPDDPQDPELLIAQRVEKRMAEMASPSCRP
jgi:hypothetical protein